MKNLLYILPLASLVVNTYAQSDSHAYATLDSIVCSADFHLHNTPDYIYANPAARHNVYNCSQTSIAVSYKHRSEDNAIIAQMGNGDQMGVVNIESVSNRSNSALWGKARFAMGRRTNVGYCETSDFLLLFPYVMGDTVGGDLTSQTYLFGAGLMHAVGESPIALGIDANYRACLEYRQVDPRPRNTISELKVCFGASYNINKNLLAIHSDFMRYKQTNEVKFFSELGNPITYHYTGVGTDYYRFRGNNTSAYYNGYGFGGGIGVKQNTIGLSASADYHYSSFEKILSTLNDLPLTRSIRHLFNAQIGYVNTSSDIHNIHLSSIYITASADNKLGHENIFGDAANNVYAEIGYVEQYKYKKRNVSATCVVNKTFSHNSLTLRADAGTMCEKHTYAMPRGELSFSQAQIGARIEDLISTNRYSLFLAASASHNAAISSEINLASVNITDASPMAYYTYMSHSNTQLAMKARLQIPTNIKHGINFFVNADASLTNFYDSNKRSTLTLSLGALF